MPHPSLDTLIIGSGPGGLTAAVALARTGQRVLVCEQHEVPGGWTHSFTLEGYRFSPGVHYIGGMQPGGHLRRIYEGLGVSQDVSFLEINPDGFDHIFIGQERFDIPSGKGRYAERLKSRFPREATGIDGYLNTVERIMTSLSRAAAVQSASDVMKLPGRAAPIVQWGLRSGQDLINHYVSDPVLKGILAGQAGDHGLPPSQVSAMIHAGVVHHYFDGGYYPMGGGFAIPRAFVRALKRAGGQVMLNTPVTRILLENQRAIGVQLADGTEIRARNVISNADPEVTFGKLIGREHLSGRLRRKLGKVTYSTSALSLFFAVDMDLRAAGLDSGNYWFYDHPDVDAIYRQGLTGHVLDADAPPGMFLTATTLKDPSKIHDGVHTLEAFAFVGYDAFKAWAGTATGVRPDDYRTLKGQLAGKMLAALDKRVPGLRESLVFCDLGTPLTNEHYVNATDGNLYGIAKSRFQVGPGAFPIKSEIEGLYMVGASTISHGVAGATSTGLAAARAILNCRTRDLLTQNGPELKVYPSEDVSQWPDHLQRRIERGRVGEVGKR
jgi:all-trans-retinol 13,14-reductase